MYAEIAVNVSLGPWTGGPDAPPPSYHYRVPPDLAAQAQAGQLVRVPFGARPAQGIILSLTETLPPLPDGTRVRPLEAISDAIPVLTPAQLHLARWIAETTFSPLAETVWAMVPPGLEERAHVMVERTEDTPPSRLGPVQQAILNALDERGPLRLDELAEIVGTTATTSLNGLIERGLVRKHWRLEPPSIKPRTIRVARLAVSREEGRAARPRLGRDTSEALALAWLAASDDPLPTVAQVSEATGVKEGALKRLAAEGLIGLTQKRTLIVAVRQATSPPSPPLVGERGRGKSARYTPPPAPPLQGEGGGERLAGDAAALLQRLRAGRAPLDLAELRAEGVKPAAMRALEEGGLARRIEEEAAVFLTIPAEEVPGTLVRLRRAERPARLLDRLLAQGPEIEATELLKRADATLDDLRALEAAGLIRIDERVAWRDPLAGQSFVLTSPPRLTPDQERVWSLIEAAFAAAPPARPFLLHGVTGSGKTEIYLHAVATALERGRQALVLVPEIALTPQTVRRFAARFPGRVTLWHSGLTPGQRYDTWQRVRAGEIDVVIGSRSALFAPLPRLGLIVVDEEHETSYKQDVTPRYHARDAALHLGHASGAVVVLGSATPDVETYAHAERGDLSLVSLPRRVLGHRQAVAEQQARLGRTGAAMQPLADLDALYTDLPPVQVVDLRAELRAGNTSLFSRALQAALQETLTRGEQAILFLNRRGAATFVMCRDCGHVLGCPRCSTTLTYHQASGSLVCHHCGHREPPPTVCPNCRSERIRHFGAGTQRVEETLLTLFPTIRVLRWDRDTTGSSRAHTEYLDAFIQGDADVLIGTQMIAKGLDLPLVTLVGVVSADTGLHLPDFRAAERTFQLLTQVAGRAARGPLGGRVIFQTYTPDHYAIQAAAQHDYDQFYAQEMEFRRATGYPPFSRLARLIYTDPTWDKARAEAEGLGRRLTDYIRRQGLTNTSLIGPAPAFFGRERGEYRWHLMLRCADPAATLRSFFAQDKTPYGWRVDVDPVSLL
ncbi:MAG: primosomal protein N' [Anaerolineae bacterium]|nr:primosomal protein N' [Anaerolineae bacterium]